MSYRIATRIIGNLDLMLSKISLIAVGCFGIFIVGDIILHFEPNSNDSNFHRVRMPLIIFFIVLFCCYSNFMADWNLVLSTEKEQDPDFAIQLMKKWVSISYLTFCFRGLAIPLVFYLDIQDSGRFHRSDLFFLVLILFPIRAFQLYCVIKYRRQLKCRQTITISDNNIVRGSGRTEEAIANCPINSAMSPIPPIIVADTNENGFRRPEMPISMGDLPSYESAVFTNINVDTTPPSYDSLYTTKDEKIPAV